jgi:hypothetical protein
MISNQLSSGKLFVYYFSRSVNFVALGSFTRGGSDNFLTVSL